MIRLLVTRPEPDAEESADRLRALGIAPVLSPLLNYHLLKTGLPTPEGLAGLVLTSANALRALDDRGKLARYIHLPVWCVGDKTAHLARQSGFTKTTSASGDAEALVALLHAIKAPGPLFYPSGQHITLDLTRALAPSGRMVITSPVYAMQPANALAEPALSGLLDQSINGALFYSRRTAETFCDLTEQVPGIARTGFTALCLSANVASPLLAARFNRIALADYPSEEAMLSLALSFARDQITS